MDVGGELPAGGRLCPLLGLFGVAMSLRSVSHRARHKSRWPKRCLTTTGVNFRTMPPMQGL